MELRDPQYGPRSLWIVLRRIVQSVSCIFEAPESKLIIGGLAIMALVLNRQAPKLIIGDRFNKGGLTLMLPAFLPRGRKHWMSSESRAKSR